MVSNFNSTACYMTEGRSRCQPLSTARLVALECGGSGTSKGQWDGRLGRHIADLVPAWLVICYVAAMAAIKRGGGKDGCVRLFADIAPW